MGKGEAEFRRVLSLAVVGILGPMASSRAAFTQKNGVVYAIRKTRSAAAVHQVVIPARAFDREIVRVTHLASGRT